MEEEEAAVSCTKTSTWIPALTEYNPPLDKDKLTDETQNDESKVCVVMVGLPARGKSLIAGKGKHRRQ